MDATRDVVVDFWFDAVCPYSWTASRWLQEVGERSQLRVRHHVMSLYFLNQDRTDVAAEYRRSVEGSRGPPKVATGVAVKFGQEVLADFYIAFRERVFDVWHRPTAAEYHEVIRVALAELRLPVGLEDAMESDDYDAPMRLSHDAGVALVGGEVGTPIASIGRVAFFGPVLNGIPRGEKALEVFEGARLLAGYPQFYELKRTRTQPPVFT